MLLLYFLRLQNQVGEVIDVMKDNVNKVMDRGYKLEELQDRSGIFEAINIIIIPVLIAGFSLKSEWLQVIWDLPDSSKYSSWS